MDISSISSNEIVNLISDVTEHEAISKDVNLYYVKIDFA